MTSPDCIEGEHPEDAHAFMCACKGEPYTFEEWQRHVLNLNRQLNDATLRMEAARGLGACLPWRFTGELRTIPTGQEET